MARSDDRRSGKDRRQTDLDLSNGKERRRSVESRKTEISEIAISEDEWLLYFGNPHHNVTSLFEKTEPIVERVIR